MSRIDPAEFRRLVVEGVPFTRDLEPEVLSLDDGHVRMRIGFRPSFLRPGGTVSGPVMMSLADVTMWGVVMTRLGPAEMAVTTHLNCIFLRRPAPAPMIAEGRLLRMGRRLAHGEVDIMTEGDPEPVFHATCTYALPDRREV